MTGVHVDPHGVCLASWRLLERPRILSFCYEHTRQSIPIVVTSVSNEGLPMNASNKDSFMHISSRMQCDATHGSFANA